MLRGISRAAEAVCIRQGFTQVVSGGASPMCSPLVGLPSPGPLAVEVGVLLVPFAGLPVSLAVLGTSAARSDKNLYKCLEM